MSNKSEILHHPDVQYLQQEPIGKVIAQGLAILFQEKPENPVDFLGKWLKNYQYALDHEQENLKALNEQENKRLQNEKIEAQNQEIKRQQQFALEQEQLLEDSFKNSILHHRYSQELLVQEFPQFLASKKNLTGVYIAEYDYPFKAVEEGNNSQLAHVDTAADKLIKYIGASDKHEYIIGKQSSVQNGVTGEIFTRQPNAEPELDENGEPKQSQVQSNYVYIPNVEYEPKINYFVIPKLGAYLALPLFYNSYLTEECFDSALKIKMDYQQKVEEQQKLVDQITSKYNEDRSAAVEQGEETVELDLKHKEFLAGLQKFEEPTFQFVQKKYVVCMDTLGQDRQISNEDRIYLESFVQFFSKSWEEIEMKILSHDLQNQINYYKSINCDHQSILDAQLAQENQELAQEQIVAQLEALANDQNLQEYEKRKIQWRLNLDILRSQEMQNRLQLVYQFRVVKFVGILQAIMYFLGYTKEEINFQNTNQVNWKHVQTILVQQDFLNKILNYDYAGQKPNQVLAYARVSELQKRVQEYNQDQVYQYNLGFGALFKWFNQTLALRVQDVELRRRAKQVLKEEREAKIAEHEDQKQNRLTKLQEHKESLSPEELEVFDEVAWDVTWREQNPEVVIPDEVADDVDNDL